MDSILTTIKKMLGITEEYKHFDTDIMVHINTVLLTLNDVGVGPEKVASIKDESDTWTGTLGELQDMEAIKTYIYLKVRLAFDPPSSSAVMDAMNKLATEIEWRLHSREEYKVSETNESDDIDEF